MPAPRLGASPYTRCERRLVASRRRRSTLTWRSAISAVVVDAPSNLGLRPPSPDTIPGCWRLPQALRQAGIVTRLDATDGGRVLPPSYTPDRDATGTRNGLAIAGYSVKLADRLGEVLDAGGFPVLLGGDCSILLGAMLALCRRGRYGLAGQGTR